MLVYGDASYERDPRTVIAEIEETLGGLSLSRFDLREHDALVTAFIDTAELAQGLADDETATHGRDRRGPLGDLALTALLSLARAIEASWHCLPARPAIARRTFERLRREVLPAMIRTKRAEGYAFYAVYPEAYHLAARRAWLRRSQARHVIGLRSIGTGLAAMVATGTGAPLPSTVRPVGDVFRRTIVAAPELVREWCDPRAVVAVVDEGPGLSGSSFGAVLDTLEENGVPLDRIECYPSHAGDLGSVASAQHRERWPRTRRHVVEVDELLVHSKRLPEWIENIAGPLLAPLRDISAGAWRALYNRTDWPPVIPQQERRKFYACTDTGNFVARFIGLGRHGAHAYDRARTLATAGFCPDVRGLAYGFMIEQWVDGRLLDPRAIDRTYLIEHVAKYLAFRARAFPCERSRGASASALLEMARRNASLALGDWTRSALARFAAADLEHRIERIEIDGRLHAWEWVVRADGTLVKTDAIDHHAAHDLVGCQDFTWDLAGASVELGLDPDDQRRLVTTACRLAGRPLDPELLAFSRVCYLAFQLGRHTIANVDASCYQKALATELQSTATATRFELR